MSQYFLNTIILAKVGPSMIFYNFILELRYIHNIFTINHRW